MYIYMIYIYIHIHNPQAVENKWSPPNPPASRFGIGLRPGSRETRAEPMDDPGEFFVDKHGHCMCGRTISNVGIWLINDGWLMIFFGFTLW